MRRRRDVATTMRPNPLTIPAVILGVMLAPAAYVLVVGLASAAIQDAVKPAAVHAHPGPPDPLVLRQDAAMAYMKAHPVPARPGMYTGIIVEGDRPGARSWIAIMAARDGELVDAECGNRALNDCSWRWRSRLLGAYVYADSEGNATAYASHPRNIHVIRYGSLTLSGTDTP